MMSFFLAPLLWAIAFVSIYLYQASEHEVTKVLAASMAAVCIIWGFAATHWGLHLLCLFVLVRYRFYFPLKPISVDKL
ncbi:hypothetical protein [[Limnothrix rosea] IAM M-220]|uniref:hypothetical protein n=1 Tax=[Limnothrix rosea] IAM M-220 TaxID=454133 RepID=UPI0009633447|nr:hypothetical protein [[Limnothrix rosea] IAM M-220]OKH19762.1 hypothetical protein NIES208_01140 [[Limnothrix rosea] IAM M-220]